MTIIRKLLVAGLTAALVGTVAPAATSAPMAAAGAGVAVRAPSHSSLHMRGTWKATKKYHRNDVVRYLNASYVARRANTDKVPTRAKYWQVLAIDGATGATGLTGTTGLTGATGATGAAGANASPLLVKDATGKVLGRFLGAFIGDIGLQVEIDGGVFLYLSNGAFVGTVEDAVVGLMGSGNVMYADAACQTQPFATFESAPVGLSYVGSFRRYLEYTDQLTGYLTGLRARAAYQLTNQHWAGTVGASYYAIKPDGSCADTGLAVALPGQVPELFALSPVPVPTTVPGPLTLATS